MYKCHSCKFKVNIPGDCHIGCTNPDKNVKGNLHGIKNGWFFYPINFDPCWMINECSNYELKV